MLHKGSGKKKKSPGVLGFLSYMAEKAIVATPLWLKKTLTSPRSESKVVICRQRRKLRLWFLRLTFKRNNKLVAIAQVKENQLWSRVFVCCLLIKTCERNSSALLVLVPSSDFHRSSSSVSSVNNKSFFIFSDFKKC